MVGRSTLQKHLVFKWQWLGIYAYCIVKPYGVVDRSNGYTPYSKMAAILVFFCLLAN